MPVPEHIAIELKHLADSSKVVSEYFADIGSSAARVKDDLMYEMRKLTDAQNKTEEIKAFNETLRKSGETIEQGYRERGEAILTLARQELANAQKVKNDALALKEKMEHEWNIHKRKLEEVPA